MLQGALCLFFEHEMRYPASVVWYISRKNAALPQEMI